MIHSLLRKLLPTLGMADTAVVIPLSGGQIGMSFRVETENGPLFVKCRDDNADIFLCEAKGLELLKKTGAFSIPEVYYAGAVQGQPGGVIVLEWIEPAPVQPEFHERLGRGIAALHQHESPNNKFGLDHDNYIGFLPQPNEWSDSWPEFLRERRLLPMVQYATDHQFLDRRQCQRLFRLMDGIEQWVPQAVRPSLLHGDLWSGNWISGPGNRPYLIDPAVFYGDREFEFAFLELFGGFSSRVLEAYREVSPLSADYSERRLLYQLYSLLVHLIHFGEMYLRPIDKVLDYYVG